MQAKTIHIHKVPPVELILRATKSQEATCMYTRSKHTMASTKTGAMVTFPEGLSLWYAARSKTHHLAHLIQKHSKTWMRVITVVGTL